jgi:hypothetical protein
MQCITLHKNKKEKKRVFSLTPDSITKTNEYNIMRFSFPLSHIEYKNIKKGDPNLTL